MRLLHILTEPHSVQRNVTKHSYLGKSRPTNDGASCYFIPVRSKHVTLHPVREHAQRMSSYHTHTKQVKVVLYV